MPDVYTDEAREQLLQNGAGGMSVHAPRALAHSLDGMGFDPACEGGAKWPISLRIAFLCVSAPLLWGFLLALLGRI